MELTGQAKLLRIFIGEADKLPHTPLHELFEAAQSGGLVTMEKVQIIRYLHGRTPGPAAPHPG